MTSRRRFLKAIAASPLFRRLFPRTEEGIPMRLFRASAIEGQVITPSTGGGFYQSGTVIGDTITIRVPPRYRTRRGEEILDCDLECDTVQAKTSGAV